MVFVATRGPAEIYTLMKLFQQSSIGLRQDDRWGSPYAVNAFETDVTINCLVYLSILLHPIIYFSFNPDYRTGVKNMWKNLSCNKDPVAVIRCSQLDYNHLFEGHIVNTLTAPSDMF